MSSSERRHVHGVDYEGVDQDYLEQRQLNRERPAGCCWPVSASPT